MHKIKPYLLLSPALFFIFIFFFYPLAKVYYMSFFDWPLNGNPLFIGFDNFTSLFNKDSAYHDEQFLQSFWFTLIYTGLVTPFLFISAFLLASLVNLPLKGISLFRSVYFAPVVMSIVATSLIWVWMFNDLYGVINYLLLKLGVIEKQIFWLGKPTLSVPAVIVSVTWKMVGFTMMILLAGMQSIPDDYYEASKNAGGNFYHHTRYITLPLLKRPFALSLILSITGSILAFDQFFIMTKGGPANQTKTLMMHVYSVSIEQGYLGAGAAMTVLIMLLLIVFSILQLWALKSPYKKGN